MNSNPTLVENLTHFGRLLRSLGVTVTTDQIEQAGQALHELQMFARNDFYWTLSASFLNRKEDRNLFDQAFSVFWHAPHRQEGVSSSATAKTTDTKSPPSQDSASDNQDWATSSVPIGAAAGCADPSADTEELPDAAATYSAERHIRKLDFEKMSSAELAEAKRMIGLLRQTLPTRPSRRYKPAPSGPRLDFQSSMRQMARTWGDYAPLRWKQTRRQPVPILVLCDVSGSMERYSRIFLSFMHTIKLSGANVNCFVFGTSLTCIDRQMKHRLADTALARIAESVVDWSGGTRIGACLKEFNRYWNRRVLSRGALVFLVSDGLDLDDAEGVYFEMDRLHKSSRQIIWLNPLLRNQDYKPLAAGAQAIAPHVDLIHPIHNIHSFEQLSRTFAALMTKNCNPDFIRTNSAGLPVRGQGRKVV